MGLTLILAIFYIYKKTVLSVLLNSFFLTNSLTTLADDKEEANYMMKIYERIQCRDQR